MAGFGKPIEPQLTDEQQADEEARKNKRFSELLAELFGDKNTDRFKSFAFPEDIKSNLNDVFDSYKVEKAKRSAVRRSLSEITVASTAVEGAHIKITKNSVKADMSQMDTAAKTQTALEMAMIAANNPNLMDSEGSMPLEGSAEDKLALYLAAQKLGFAEKIDQKSLEGVNELAPEKQQAIAEAMEASWAQAKESLSSFTGDAAEPANDDKGEEKPAAEDIAEDKKEKADFDKAAKGESDDKPKQDDKPKGPDVARIKADFDQPIGGILNFYHQQYDKEAVETIKTKLLALYYFEKDKGEDILPKFRGNIDFKSDQINSAEALESFMSEQQVPAEFIKQAEDEVAAWKPAPKDFPKMGEIADGYRLTNRDVKNELLVAQAVIRTMDRVQRMKAGNPQEETDQNKSNLGHIGKFPNDPAALQIAQANYAMATVAEEQMLAGSEPRFAVENIEKTALNTLDNAIEALKAHGENKAVESLTAVSESYKPYVLSAEQRIDSAEKPAPAADAKLAGWGLKPNNG